MKKILTFSVVLVLVVCSFEACDYFAHANNEAKEIALIPEVIEPIALVIDTVEKAVFIPTSIFQFH